MKEKEIEKIEKLYNTPSDKWTGMPFMSQMGLKVHNPYGYIVMNDQDFGDWVTVRKPNPHWWKFYVGLLLIIAGWVLAVVALFFATVYLLNWLSQFPGLDTGMAPVVGLYDWLAIVVLSGIAWDYVGELPSGRMTVEIEEFITK